MFAAPVATLVANPCLLLVLLIVAAAVLSELHCAVAVMSCVLPSVNVPVAENCFVVPRGITGIAGVTAIDTSVAGLTLSVVVPVIEPKVALTLVPPTAALVASPGLFTLAMAELAVLQITELVTSRVLPSLYVPVALSGSVVPRANDAFAGVIANDTSAGGPTVSVDVPAIAPTVAVIVVLPCPAPDASPPLLTPATVGTVELQLAVPVRSSVLLSL